MSGKKGMLCIAEKHLFRLTNFKFDVPLDIKKGHFGDALPNHDLLASTEETRSHPEMVGDMSHVTL